MLVEIKVDADTLSMDELLCSSGWELAFITVIYNVLTLSVDATFSRHLIILHQKFCFRQDEAGAWLCAPATYESTSSPHHLITSLTEKKFIYTTEITL